jgi:hypothetical protein
VRTRDRLNWGFAIGSLTLAILLGVLTQSATVFWVSLIVLLVLNVMAREIRL